MEIAQLMSGWLETRQSEFGAKSSNHAMERTADRRALQF